MSASASLIPELEDVIQHGSQDKRAATVKRIANLFVDGAPHFNEDHIGLFDDVLCRLVVEIETKARAEMAQTLAPIANAPIELMRKLAHDDDIAVAGPVLTQSPRLQETELVELARTKGQAHLAAIAGRKGIGEAVTDVLVRRGDTEVMRNVADNQSAKLSEGGFSALVKRAEGDGDLAEKVGQRPDIPAHLFRDLLVRATAVVQQRLLQAAKPETRSRNPARARQGFQGIRQQRAGARLRRRAARGASRCIRPASSASPSWPNSPRTRNSRRRWPRCRCSAACRSRPRTG